MMKKVVMLFILVFVSVSCKKDSKNQEVILKGSIGRVNSILTVIKGSLWHGSVGDEIRKVFGQHQVGLPQPETLVSMSQVDPSGFTDIMNGNKSVMIVNLGEAQGIKVVHDKYAQPQVLVYVTAKDEYDLKKLFNDKGEQIIEIFKNEDIKFSQRIFKNKKLDETKFNTIRDLGISLIIPDDYRLVKDSVGFLWLRHHLKSGIARGDGTNNILVYSLPLEDETKVLDDITNVRDIIGQKHIPGSEEGKYMITEQAYTPHTFEVVLDGKKTYETRGKWEVKDDFMAGPFINYTIIDKPNNRLIVYEGFTYAPSVNKRDFIFELEAIGKSIKIK